MTWCPWYQSIYNCMNDLAFHYSRLIDQFHKPQNAPVPYPTMLHSEQKCAHFFSEWSIVRYGTDAFWDLQIRSIDITSSTDAWLVLLSTNIMQLTLYTFYVHRNPSITNIRLSQDKLTLVFPLSRYHPPCHQCIHSNVTGLTLHSTSLGLISICRCHLTAQEIPLWSGLILGLRPANEGQHYFVKMSLIGWVQA